MVPDPPVLAAEPVSAGSLRLRRRGGLLALEASNRAAGTASSLDASGEDQGTDFALISRSLPSPPSSVRFRDAPNQRGIAAEEQLLRRELPSYAAYSERRRKLVPFGW